MVCGVGEFGVGNPDLGNPAVGGGKAGEEAASKAARQQLGQADGLVSGARMVCGASPPTTTVSCSCPTLCLQMC